ncbi:MAG: DUF3310 domain-containing protein [Acidimicrobiales bacterium]|jgi:hypothetical protein
MATTGPIDLYDPTLFSEEEMSEGSSDIDNPSHYSRWKIEPITFIMENEVEFWRGNIIKYAMRAGYKHRDGLKDWEAEIEDLEKIRRYAEMRINHIKGEETL